MEKPKTYVDVLEEMQEMLDSIVNDLCDIRYFYGKDKLVEAAIVLSENTRRAVWFARAGTVDAITRDAYTEDEELPF